MRRWVVDTAVGIVVESRMIESRHGSDRFGWALAVVGTAKQTYLMYGIVCVIVLPSALVQERHRNHREIHRNRRPEEQSLYRPQDYLNSNRCIPSVTYNRLGH